MVLEKNFFKTLNPYFTFWFEDSSKPLPNHSLPYRVYPLISPKQTLLGEEVL